MDPKYAARDANISQSDSDSEGSYTDGDSESSGDLVLGCAAWHTSQEQCDGSAVICCKKCRLVAYCSKECRDNDLEDHHAPKILLCYPRSTNYPNGEIPDHPLFETIRFWANYPAADVLNLAKNEGSHFDGVLRLLLLGPFALRHLIYSVVAMPETANPSLEVTLLECEISHLVRTFLSLLVLSLDTIDSSVAAEVAVDVWYSANWANWTYNLIEKYTGQTLRDLDQKIQAWYEDKQDELTSCYKATFGTPGYLIFHVSLDWYVWTDLIDCCLQEPELGSMAEARADDVSKYGEPLDRIFRTFSSSRTAALMKWRLDGIVQPHGESATGYTIPNPAFILPGTGQAEGITNEPLSEWPMNEILDYGPYPAEDDVYGKMNFYLREKVMAFRARLKKKPIIANVIACGEVEMLGHISTYHQEMRFYDRIEVGNFFDLEPQLCLLSCVPLLRHAAENPCATMLTLSRESVLKVEDEEARETVDFEKYNLYHPAFDRLETMAPLRHAVGEPYSAVLVPRHTILFIHRQWNLFSRKYIFNLERFGFALPGDEKPQHPRAPVAITGYLGALGKGNSILSMWGNHLLDEDSNPTEKEYMRWASWPAAKPQFWLEWKRKRDVTDEEFFQHLTMMKGEAALRWWKKLYGGFGVKKEEDERNGGDETAVNGHASDPHEVREEEKDEGSDRDEAEVNGHASDPRDMATQPLLERIQTGG
ncbi:uncharacterized protein Triagg1_1542 [Trichoderma aggressivum f. europaeum]|uniref:DUF4470 domain-containing protein n=1 Tax=Trichoderma aggressivum f. europaeum TaxID=173218 RepID=A0AAE1IJX9_9HYPO|nr:hypothetical protein Triagg1_1542 [Trichoderma aggressivum f. europaeum]